MSLKHQRHLKRREFIKYSALGVASLPAMGTFSLCGKTGGGKTQIALFKTDDRKEGVRRVLDILKFSSVDKKEVYIKPNFNTADPAPGSTHNDTLTQLIHEMRERGAAGITLGERSGPPDTKQVMEDKGVIQLSKDLDFKIINFEDLSEEEWVHFNPEGNHWNEGFSLPRSVIDAEYLLNLLSEDPSVWRCIYIVAEIGCRAYTQELDAATPQLSEYEKDDC